MDSYRPIPFVCFLFWYRAGNRKLLDRLAVRDRHRITQNIFAECRHRIVIPSHNPDNEQKNYPFIDRINEDDSFSIFRNLNDAPFQLVNEWKKGLSFFVHTSLQSCVHRLQLVHRVQVDSGLTLSL